MQKKILTIDLKYKEILMERDTLVKKLEI
jgi:hypothetical protein